MTYRRLDHRHADPTTVCLVHGLLKYPKITALLDAEKMRQETSLGTAEAHAQAARCTQSEEPGEVWHIYIPSKGHMKTIRRKLRREGKLSRVQD